MRKLMVGKSDFRQVMEGGYYYVDKTLLVREILDGGEVTLATRPRRFGKTLNLSMLYYFFSDREDSATRVIRLAIAVKGKEVLVAQAPPTA